MNVATSRAAQDTDVVSDSEPAEGDEDWCDRALNVRKQIKKLRLHTLVHVVFFAAGLAGHLFRVTGNWDMISVDDIECWDGRSVQ